VRKVHIDEGNEVKKGWLLIEIDQADYLTQLAQAEAACEAVQTQLLEAQRDLDLQIQRQGSELARARALVDAKKSKLSEAETDLVLERDKSKNSILEPKPRTKGPCPVSRRWSMASRRRKATRPRQTIIAEGIIATERRDQTQVAVDQAAARYASAREGVEQAKARHAATIGSEKMVELQSRRVTRCERR